ncbi:aldehyde dehydrogenase, dimeric NADP-preferring isoform X3 [Hydra vulgaris]|uniref:Aldehyde dehydrogenase n=2 Tax=Hydra vulgaris TaxID=6087 RepID=A0ABM4CC10_HYDVU
MNEYLYSKDVSELRRSFREGKMKSLDNRLTQLRLLHKLLEEGENELCDAVYKDLKKCRVETNMMEFLQIRIELGNATQNLEKWMKPKQVKGDLINKLNTCQLHKDPLGVVLIIGAWNLPLWEIFLPLVGALSAGNCAILKPSELSPHTALVIEKLVPKYLNRDCIKVINGGVAETTALLRERFDYIFYTGSTNVGRIVMKAAAEHLTPVTLELGGKCPAIVDSTCNFSVVAQRIAWSKFSTCGQLCLAVDYILCLPNCEEALVAALIASIKKFYGDNPKTCESYGRIVNKHHHQRISKLIDKSKVVYGGEIDEDDLYIAPTILTNVTPNDLIMKEEIFGPLLPIITVSSLQEAVDFINERDKPLAVYMFSNDEKSISFVTSETSSGGMCINDAAVHAAVPNLPFGGVGKSGMGSYHGKKSFNTFSHTKSYLYKNQRLENLNAVRYPPYKDDNAIMKWTEWILKPTLK